MSFWKKLLGVKEPSNNNIPPDPDTTKPAAANTTTNGDCSQQRHDTTLCDICNAPETGTLVLAKQLSDAVRRGFNPFRSGCIPEAMARMAAPDYPERWARSATSGPTSQSDWNVCANCMSKLSAFLPTPDAHDTQTITHEPSQIPEVLEKAYGYHQKVMTAANTGRVDAAAEANLHEALKWLDRLCDLDKTHGEPRSLRGDMYMVLAQIGRQSEYLEKAREDFTAAINLGSRDAANTSTWKQNLRSVESLRQLL